jgi:hypothetical protein
MAQRREAEVQNVAFDGSFFAGIATILWNPASLHFLTLACPSDFPASANVLSCTQ